MSESIQTIWFEMCTPIIKPILVTGALAILCACSSAVDAPRDPRVQSRSSELGVFMKTHINPPFSKISFLLFHGEADETAGINPDVLPASANELAQAAERLSKWPQPPSGSTQSTLVFHEYASALRNDAVRLIEALKSPQRDAAARVFESLRKKCDSCHHFFRYDESANRENRSKLAASEVPR
jgi:hypothetical protein